MDQTARAIIRQLDLQPHPEGGWYRETWRAPAEPGSRAAGTAIYFLLEEHQRSHWHRVDAAEIWCWHAGDPVTLLTADSDTYKLQMVVLGDDLFDDQVPQAIVPPNTWQAASPSDGWALVSCVVAPGFEFSGFELAPEGWMPPVC